MTHPPHRRWVLAAALALAACGGGAGNDAEGNAAEAAPQPSPTGPPPKTPVLANPPVANTSVLAAPAPVPQAEASLPEGPIAPGSAEDAGQVVQSYFALAEAGRRADANQLWEPQATAARQQFAAGYADYHAEVGAPGRVDSGAGQRYVTIPVKLRGTLKTGAPFVADGAVVLHRTAEIDGATAAQQRWRIRSIDLKAAAETAAPTAANARYRCMDGSRLAAAFDNRRNTVTLRRDGRVLGTLAGQRPASGLWYRGNGFELRGKGRDATFGQPGLPPLACRAISAR